MSLSNIQEHIDARASVQAHVEVHGLIAPLQALEPSPTLKTLESSLINAARQEYVRLLVEWRADRLAADMIEKLLTAK